MVSQQEPVVTGDAVVLDVQIAQLPVRALSAIIDVTVVFILYITGVV
ncbi:MAG: RDD family protein, partial [Mycobacterium sp.]